MSSIRMFWLSLTSILLLVLDTLLRIVNGAISGILKGAIKIVILACVLGLIFFLLTVWNEGWSLSDIDFESVSLVIASIVFGGALLGIIAAFATPLLAILGAILGAILSVIADIVEIWLPELIDEVENCFEDNLKKIHDVLLTDREHK